MKKPKTPKSPKKKKPEAFGISQTPVEDLPPQAAPAPLAGSVSADQPPTDGMAELKKLEAELSLPKAAPAKPGEPGKAAAGPTAEGEAKPRRRKFKRPPPENTIRMTIRQYWRFRAWLANRKLQLPPELFAAILDGTDQTLVEPLVEPVVAVMDEYIPEEWVAFIEDKSPILTFMIALFEAEQSFGARLAILAAEIRKADAPRSAAPQSPDPQQSAYPKKGEL